jgi:putative sterol carrier protein
VSAVVERFAALSAPELHQYFCSTDVLEITAMIRDASDAELRALIDLDPFREEAVDAILDRFGEFSDAKRLAEIDGVVRFELTRTKSKPECHTARFAGGSVTLEPDAAPDVTIVAGIVDFVRLVTGQSNAALLYLCDRLGIAGDELLALAVGTVFMVPGSDRAAVDPTALDPVDVATAVATTSGKHLRSVMGGGFRPIVLEEVFRRFPDFIDTGKAQDLQLVVGFRIAGRGDGEVDRYVVRIAEGVCTIDDDPPEGQRRDATITIEGHDFLRLATGQLNPVRGVLTGALKVKGDRAKALALNAVMMPPQPRS